MTSAEMFKQISGLRGRRYLNGELIACRSLCAYAEKGCASLTSLPPEAVLRHIYPFLGAVNPGNRCAAGISHSCAITEDGRLVCIGRNEDGECNVPADLGSVRTVAAGGFHTCAITEDDRLVCFGDGRYGQCDAPAVLGSVRTATVGAYHTCAIAEDGRLVCFGNNRHGQCDVPADLGPVRTDAARACHP